MRSKLLKDQNFAFNSSAVKWISHILRISDELKHTKSFNFDPHPFGKFDAKGSFYVVPAALCMHIDDADVQYLLILQKGVSDDETLRIYFAFLAQTTDSHPMVVELSRIWAKQIFNMTVIQPMDLEWLANMVSGARAMKIDIEKPHSSWLQTIHNAPKIKVRAVMVSPQTNHLVDATVLDRFAKHAMDSTTKLEKQIASALIAKLGGELVAPTPASKFVEDEASDSDVEESTSMTSESLPSNDTVPSDSNTTHERDSVDSDTSSRSSSESESDISNLIASGSDDETSSSGSEIEEVQPKKRLRRSIIDDDSDDEPTAETEVITSNIVIASNLLTATVGALKELKDVSPKEQYDSVINRMLARLESSMP